MFVAVIATIFMSPIIIGLIWGLFVQGTNFGDFLVSVDKSIDNWIEGMESWGENPFLSVYENDEDML